MLQTELILLPDGRFIPAQAASSNQAKSTAIAQGVGAGTGAGVAGRTGNLNDIKTPAEK